MLLIDVDLFKRYNDHFGQVMGDECLQTLAKVISLTLNLPEAFVARFGGVEFAVLLPRTGMLEARALAEEIRWAVFEMKMPHPGSASGVQTVSVGVAVLGCEGEGKLFDLVGRANRALERAKELGRNRVVAG